MAARPPAQDTFTVRLPQCSQSEIYSVCKFAGTLNVDPTQWSSMTLEREDNSQTYTDPQLAATAGAGSEFGKAARELARRKKRGFAIKEYKPNDQPWLMSVKQGSSDKQFKGVKEGGIGEHADFWIFMKAGDGVFDALPVKEWYNFLPVVRYKTFDIEEAEEQFQRRNKILNQFALRTQLQSADDGDEDALSKKNKKDLRISDAEELGAAKSSDSEADDEKVKDADEAPKRAAQSKGAKKHRKNVDNEDDVASADSDDGDDEGREVDYMSDSESESSDNDPDAANAVTKQLVSVAEESGLREDLVSDASDEEEQETDKNDAQELGDTLPTGDAPPGKDEADGKESSSESSDSDDPDNDEFKFKSLLLPAKRPEDGGTATASSAGPGVSKTVDQVETGKKGVKRKDHGMDKGDQPTTKMSKVSSSTFGETKGITEDEVRRYLQRKPHSTKDLLAKFKSRCEGMNKSEIVTKLAEILKKIKPEQYKKNDVLFFSLK